MNSNLAIAIRRATVGPTLLVIAVAVANPHTPPAQDNAKPFSASSAAREYAQANDLTKCVTPDKAFSSNADTVLTIEVDPMGRPTNRQIVPVSLDDALRSTGSRLNIIACQE